MSDWFKKSRRVVLASLGIQQTLPFRLNDAAVMSVSVDTVLESLGSACWQVGAHNCPAEMDSILMVKDREAAQGTEAEMFLCMQNIMQSVILLTCGSCKNIIECPIETREPSAQRNEPTESSSTLQCHLLCSPRGLGCCTM